METNQPPHSICRWRTYLRALQISLIFSLNMKCAVSFAAFIVVVAFETRLCSTPEATAWNYQPKSISFSKSTRASRSHTSNSTNTFRIERDLFICGEISPSPGQEWTRSKPKYLWWMYKNCTNTKTRYCVLAILVGHMPNACSYLYQPSSIIYSTKKSNGHDIKHQQSTKQICRDKRKARF